MIDSSNSKGLGVCTAMAGGLLTLLFSSCSSGQRAQIERDFVVIPSAHLHLLPSEEDDKKGAELDSSYVNLLKATNRQPVRADFRYALNVDGVWGLVCTVGPGEASSDRSRVIIPYDAEKDHLGEPLEVASSTWDCNQRWETEAWLQDVDGDGSVDVVMNTLEWAVPDSLAEYCQDGQRPHYRLTVRKYMGGRWHAASTKNLVIEDYEMAATPEMVAEYRDGGQAALLPSHLR